MHAAWMRRACSPSCSLSWPVSCWISPSPASLLAHPVPAHPPPPGPCRAPCSCPNGLTLNLQAAAPAGNASTASNATTGAGSSGVMAMAPAPEAVPAMPGAAMPAVVPAPGAVSGHQPAAACDTQRASRSCACNTDPCQPHAGTLGTLQRPPSTHVLRPTPAAPLCCHHRVPTRSMRPCHRWRPLRLHRQPPQP